MSQLALSSSPDCGQGGMEEDWLSLFTDQPQLRVMVRNLLSNTSSVLEDKKCLPENQCNQGRLRGGKSQPSVKMVELKRQ